MTLNKNAMLRCYPVTPFSKSHAVTQSHCHAPKIKNLMIRRYADTPKYKCNAKTQTLFYSPEEIKKNKRHADTATRLENSSSLYSSSLSHKKLGSPQKRHLFLRKNMNL